jgi:cell division protein FtsL
MLHFKVYNKLFLCLLLLFVVSVVVVLVFSHHFKKIFFKEKYTVVSYQELNKGQTY